MDSIDASYGQVVLVDNGGFFPDDDTRKDASWFLMDAMQLLHTDAVGTSERELRYGLGYLKAQVKRSHLPMVCANLLESKSGKLVLAPYVLKQVGTVKVGIFGLMSNAVDLGPAKDSLRVEDPTVAAKRVVGELRKKGATVVVLLSQLGKVESEDLVSAVDGIDAVMVGHNVPLLQKGRLVKNTVACYGGEQGQYIGRTILTLDASRHMTTGDNETFILGPEIADRKDMASLVKSFEDSLNDKLRKAEMEQAAKSQEKAAAGSAEHYVGGDMCARCHPKEAAQWETTKHAQAFASLVAAHQQGAADCVRCHVVGMGQPGGFRDTTSTPALANVQCESCHGMGSQHDAYASTPRKVTELTCRTCHTKDTSPQFDYARYEPWIDHAGAGTRQPLPDSPMKAKVAGGR